MKLTSKLETKLSSNTDTDLYREYYIFKNQIVDYAKNWEKYKYDLKAAFIYNYANFLLSIASGATEQIEKAIVYFQQASAYYANNARKKEKEETDNKITEAKDLLAQIGPKTQTSLEVSIPFFLISQTQKGIIQSISIEAKLPLAAGSSKIKTEILLQSSPQSSLIKLKNAKRNHTEQEAKNAFFQSKKSRLEETDHSKNFPYKRLVSGMLLRNKCNS